MGKSVQIVVFHFIGTKSKHFNSRTKQWSPRTLEENATETMNTATSFKNKAMIAELKKQRNWTHIECNAKSVLQDISI